MAFTQTPLLLLLLILSVSILTIPSSSSSTDSFIYGGCSQQKYTPASPYETTVNSMLTSLVNSAMSTNYNNFTIQAQPLTLYGLFQCRGDLSTADCGRCVAYAVTQLGTLCLDSCGAALQLDGCFVKYDNNSFLGVEDETVVVKKCGPLVGYDSDALTRRDAVLGYLGTGDGSYKPYRVGGSGDVTGVAQCVGDLSVSECQDCLLDAIGRLKTECGAAKWGDMFLAKCYARYSEGGHHSHDDNNNDEEIEKTLAILIGMIAGIALLVIFISSLRKMCDDKGKGGGK